MKNKVKAGTIAVGLMFAGSVWAGSAPMPATAMTVPPVLKQKVVPFAPRSGSGWTVGCVLVQYDISNAGVPENIRILDSAPDHALDRDAISTLQQWRYQPATRAGQPVAATGFKQMLTFRAPGNPASPPYRLCGGRASNENPVAYTATTPVSTARVNLGITRAPVVQTFKAAPQSVGHMPRKGRVSVRFCVNPQGHTENLRVVQSAPAGIFDQMAITLMRAAVFQPHEANGVRVTACGITQPIVFKAAAPY